MSATAATAVTSLDGFHATCPARRADALAGAFFDAVNARAQVTPYSVPGTRGAIEGASGLLLTAGAACGVLVRAATAGPIRSAARR